jgi:hypothetical protein
VCENAFGAARKLTARADANGGGAETATTLDLSEKPSRSDAGGMRDDCGAKSPRSGSCDVRALASLEGMAQRVTSLERVPVGCSSLTLNVLQGRASLRARAECFATFALDVAAGGVDFGGGVGSAEPLGMS